MKKLITFLTLFTLVLLAVPAMAQGKNEPGLFYSRGHYSRAGISVPVLDLTANKRLSLDGLLATQPDPWQGKYLGVGLEYSVFRTSHWGFSLLGTYTASTASSFNHIRGQDWGLGIGLNYRW